MKNYLYLKPNFYIFTFLTFVSNALIYVLQFYLNKNKVDYYLCTDIKTYTYSLFSKSLDLIYPESCDLKIYAEGILNVNSFYSLSEFVYLDRPVFVLYIAFFYKILNLFISSIGSIAILKISFFLGQLFLTSLICVVLIKIFNLIRIEVGNKYLVLPWLISVSPMFKWHIFESTSMTFTFLIFLLGIYIHLNTKRINLKIYFFSIGLLFLIHRSALLILVFFVLYNLITKQINKEHVKSTLYFFIPVIMYYISIYLFSNYSDHQAEEYRQFIWILDFIQGKETRTSGYFCQTPKLAVICYKNDLLKLLTYLAIPILTIIFFIFSNYKKLTSSIKQIYFLALIFSLLINIFWFFIGWYPPVRFSYYGFGNFVILICIIIFFSLNDKAETFLFFIGYTFYFIFLNHWNSPIIVEQNLFIKFSIFFFIGALIMDYTSKKL